MIPRRDSSFHKLTSPFLKGLYLTGMPRKFLAEQDEQFTFRGEKTARGMLTPAVQKRAHELFLKNLPGDQQFALFHSSPSDHQALQCVCEILKAHFKENFGSFEFVSPSEPLPTDPERIKALYVVVGGHTSDDATTHMIRRWVRAPLGSAIWVVCGGDKIWDWTQDKLGVKPDFLFSLRSGGVSVG